MSRASQPTVLIVGDYKESLIVVRSLGRAGCKLIVGKAASQEPTFAEHSRYTNGVWKHPDFDREVHFVPALLNLLRSRADVDYVIPVGDAPVSCLARHWSELPATPPFLMAPGDVVMRCHDKIQMYDCAMKLGIPTAAYASIRRRHELREAVRRIGFPCVIKPANSPREFLQKEKAVICNSVADFSKWQGRLPQVCFLVVQKFAAGHRRNCHFIARDGRILAYFEQKVLRTDRLDGTGNGMYSTSVYPAPELFHYSARLVEDLQYSGVGTAQFLFQEDTREAHFLEINPRFDATIALPYQCGFDIPLMMLQMGSSPEVPRGIQQNYPKGKRVHSFTEDALAIKRLILHQSGTLRTKLGWVMLVVEAWWNSDYHMTFDWSDPMPSLRLWGKTGTVAASGLISKAFLLLHSRSPLAQSSRKDS